MSSIKSTCSRYEVVSHPTSASGPDLYLQFTGNVYSGDATILYNYLCGDVDDDKLVNIIDIVYLINYKYKNGPAPVAAEVGDVNKDANAGSWIWMPANLPHSVFAKTKVIMLLLLLKS